MKVANAAYVMAADAVNKAGIELTGDVIIEHVCAELMGSGGTTYAINQGIKADYYVIGEPTELKAAIRHGGIVAVNIHTIGKMKHYGTEEVLGEKGVNAIEKCPKS